MKNKPWIIALSLLVLASLACNAVMGANNTPAPEINPGQPANTMAPDDQATVEPLDTESPTDEPPAGVQPTDDNQKFETEFPLPPESSGFIDMGNGAINFQTKTDIKEVLAFYRESFTKKGYKEREINTAITDTTFSIVFDGHSNGKAIVVQAVDMGSGVVNVNIRFEDI